MQGGGRMAEFYEFSINPLIPSDYSAWYLLYRAYLDSTNQIEISGSVAGIWQGLLHQTDRVMLGLIAFAEKIPAQTDPTETEQNVPVGLVHICAPVGTKGDGWIDALYVAPSWRGQGAGDSLLYAACQWGGKLSWHTITTQVADNNYRARSLLDRHGALQAKCCYTLSLSATQNGAPKRS